MRLLIDDHFYISIIRESKEVFNCRIMELIHGLGMEAAYETEPEEAKEDIVRSVIYESDIFTETSKVVHSLEELFSYHKQCVIELINSDY